MILYGITPRAYRNVTLLIGSLVFYALGEPKYLLLLVISLLMNYVTGLHLGRPKRESRQLHRKRKKLFVRQRKKERTGDALALEGDEGRD